MDRKQIAINLRNDKSRHYNCTQAVFIAFSDLHDVDHETAYSLGFNFGGGMRIGSVCGAISGGLMVLGMLKRPKTEILSFIAAFEEKHKNINCADLLLKVDETHTKECICMEFICDCIELIENILEQDSTN